MVALLAFGGAADLVSSVWRQTILQTHAPDEMRGRMQGVFMVVVAGGPRLGDLRAGATASWLGPPGRGSAAGSPARSRCSSWGWACRPSEITASRPGSVKTW